jgi:hypothetical protein
VEATKKTSVTKAALLVVAALSMLLSGLFVATASRSDASPPAACPDGFNLTADGKNCFQNAVVTSADNPNTCAEGLLTPDGSKCYIAARLIPQEGSTSCPKGFSPDDSLGGMCARFEPAPQQDPGCPDGARGAAGGCYILVAKGPDGGTNCAAGSSLEGGICIQVGNAPVPGPGSCPQAADIVQDGCFRIVNRLLEDGSCEGDYTAAFSECKYVAEDLFADPPELMSAADCPAVGNGTPVVEGQNTHQDGTVKFAFCVYIPNDAPGDCPGDSEPLTTTTCRDAVALVSTGLVCPDTGFAVVGNRCIAQATGTAVPAQCPVGSFEDSANQCRKPVADAAGAFFCADASAALNGKNCVYTAPFTVEKAPDAYKCDKGTRAVIGDQVLCFLGDADANVTSGPSCLQGVLSTDNLFCIVPRIDTAPAAVAAPVPSFTG